MAVISLFLDLWPLASLHGGVYSAFLAIFSPVVRPSSFGLGMGPITPPGPAMVGTDRKGFIPTNHLQGPLIVVIRPRA